MVFNGEGLGLCVKMTDLSHPHAARRGTEGRILDGLELLDIGWGCVGKPGWGGIGEEGTD